MHLLVKKRGFSGKRAEGGLVLRHLASIVFSVMIIILLFMIASKYAEFSSHEKTYFSKDVAYAIDILQAVPGKVLIDYPNGIDRYEMEIKDSEVIFNDKNMLLSDENKSQRYVNSSIDVLGEKPGDDNYISNDAKAGKRSNDLSRISVGDAEEYASLQYRCPSIAGIEMKASPTAAFYHTEHDEKVSGILDDYRKVFDTYINKNVFGDVKDWSDEQSDASDADLFFGVDARFDSRFYAVVHYDIDSPGSEVIACNIANSLEGTLFDDKLLVGKDMSYLKNRDSEQVFVEFRLSDEDSAVNQFRSSFNDVMVKIADEISLVYKK